jgi:hypothetical protein
VDQTLQGLGERRLGEMITRLTKSDAANQYFSDQELLSRERVQVEALGYDISSGVM